MGSCREYLFNDQVRLKKYFYVLRPLFAIRYVEAGVGIPPIEFRKLVDAVAPAHLKPGTSKLLEIKSRTKELGLGEPAPEIGEFIETELERHGNFFSGEGRLDIHEKTEVIEELNEIFRDCLVQSWSEPT
ncbi:MAG: nucleotidyltransferase domain-containing protein [Cyanobacteria bacterium P01_H01_bin.15]